MTVFLSLLALATIVTSLFLFMAKPSIYSYLLSCSIVVVIMNTVEQDGRGLSMLITVLTTLVLIVSTALVCQLTLIYKPEKMAKAVMSMIFIIALLGMTLFHIAKENEERVALEPRTINKEWASSNVTIKTQIIESVDFEKDTRNIRIKTQGETLSESYTYYAFMKGETLQVTDSSSQIAKVIEVPEDLQQEYRNKFNNAFEDEMYWVNEEGIVVDFE